MRVLVTGQNGYVGTVLVPQLLAAGHDVVGMDTNLYSGASFACNVGTVMIPNIEKDIRDAVASDFEGCDAVIHLAGLSNDPLGDLNPQLTYDINFRASVKLAKLAKAAGVERYIFSSSCSNYGAGVTEWLDEGSEFNPVTPYGRSKVLVEQFVSEMADDHFSPTFLRSGTAYGVSPRLRFDLVLNNLTAWAYTTGRVYLKSDGSPWRPVVHIEDMARAFVAVLDAPRARVHNEAFNVGRTSENYQIRDLAQIVVDTVPGSVLEFAPDAGPDKRNYRVKSDKLAACLPSYQPQWTAERGAQQLYEAYKAIDLRPGEFEGPRYRRIHHIKQLIGQGRLSDELRWAQQQVPV